MTHRDTTMLGRCIDAVCQELYEHTRPADEMERATSETLVRAILNELKQVDEGMVIAGLESLASGRRAPFFGDEFAKAFASAIDHVLSQGEG